MFFTDEPTTWPDAAQPSLLHVLLLFVGVPLLITAVIVLLVMAPSLAKGPRYSPGQPWDAEPEWFGAPEQGALEQGALEQGAAVESLPAHRALEQPARHSEPLDSGQPTGSTIATAGSAATGSSPAPAGDEDTGGASVRW